MGHPASLPRHRGRSKAVGLPGSHSQGPNGGVADSLDEAKAAFRAAGEGAARGAFDHAPAQLGEVERHM